MTPHAQPSAMHILAEKRQLFLELDRLHVELLHALSPYFPKKPRLH